MLRTEERRLQGVPGEVFWQLEIEHQQGDGDRHDAVAEGDEPFGRQRVIARMSDHGQLAAINAGLLVSCFAAAVKEPQPLLLRCGNHLEQNLDSSQA